MELKSAINVVIIVVAAAVAMLIGDFLGNRVGRARFAVAMGILVLVAFVGFGVYAAIVLLMGS
jgi:hypothetical protein